MNQALSGKRILVTQATSFMGPALCEVLAQHGAIVIANTDPLTEVGAAEAMIKQSVALPMRLQEVRLIEASRFGVTHEAGADLVEMALFKACYLYCKQINVEWIVIAGRVPFDAYYEHLMFEDIFPGLGFIPLLHADSLPHRIMSLSVAMAEERWAAANHPNFDFHFRIRHPDIDLSGPVYSNPSPIKRTAYPQLSAGHSKY